MIYLILTIVSNVFISLAMRLGKDHCRGDLGMLAMNYLTCTLLSMGFAGFNLVPQTEGLAFTIGIGAINGAIYLSALLLFQWNLPKNGVVLPTMFMKLGVIVPTIMAITVMGEKPEWYQIVGIIAAVAAIILIQDPRKKGEKIGSGFALILLLLCCGCADGMAKVFETYGYAALNDQFLMFTFGSALVFSLILCIVRKKPIGIKDALFGVMLGVPNYFGSRFLLAAVKELEEASVVYPTYSVGTIIIVTIIGALCFGEKLNKRKYVAMGIIMMALVLLNINVPAA